MNQEQRETRRTRCTGTKVAAILGKSKFRTPFDVYAQAKKLVEDTPQTPQMLRGIVMERALLDYYEEFVGSKVARPDNTFVHPHEDWMAASPDGFWEQDGGMVIVDAKTSRDRSAWGRPGTDDVPVDYSMQLHWYAAVMSAYFDKPVVGLEVVVFFTMTDEIEIYKVRPDPELGEKLIERCRDWWWKHVIAGVAPEIDHGKSVDKMLDNVQFTNNELIETEDEGIIATIKELVELKKDIKRLDNKKKSLENKVKTFIGTSAGIFGGGYRATWKPQRGRDTFNTKRFKAEHPDLAEQYVNEGKPYRILRIK
jgi:predicted phage-related endonuclease